VTTRTWHHMERTSSSTFSQPPSRKSCSCWHPPASSLMPAVVMAEHPLALSSTKRGQPPPMATKLSSVTSSHWLMSMVYGEHVSMGSSAPATELQLPYGQVCAHLKTEAFACDCPDATVANVNASGHAEYFESWNSLQANGSNGHVTSSRATCQTRHHNTVPRLRFQGLRP